MAADILRVVSVRFSATAADPERCWWQTERFKPCKGYNEVRALRLAIEQYPLPIENALATTGTPAPLWETIDEDAWASATAYAQDVQARLKAANEVELDEVVMGSPEIADETFGPFGIASPLDSAGTNVYLMPSSTASRSKEPYPRRAPATLALEPWDNDPELEAEFRANDLADPTLPMFFDVELDP